jgi:hypothetical protein
MVRAPTGSWVASTEQDHAGRERVPQWSGALRRVLPGHPNKTGISGNSFPEFGEDPWWT